MHPISPPPTPPPPTDTAIIADEGRIRSPWSVFGDQLSDGALVVDGDGRIAFANRAASLLLGRARSALVGQELAVIFAAFRDPRFASSVREAMKGTAPRAIPTGESEGIGGAELRFVPLGDGQVAILLAPRGPAFEARDLDEALEAAQQERAESEFLARLLAALARASDNMSEALELLADGAAALLGAAGAAVGPVEDGEARVQAAVGSLAGATGSRLSLPGSLSELALVERRALFVNEVLGHPRVNRDVAAAFDIRQWAVAPLIAEGVVLGLLSVVNPKRGAFTDRDAALLQRLADHGAVALRNAQLYRSTVRTARHAGILAATARTLAMHVAPAALYDGIARIALDQLGACGFSVYTVDRDTRHVERTHAHGAGVVDLPLLPAEFWTTDMARVVHSETPLFVSRLDHTSTLDTPARRRALLDAGIRASAALPLFVEGSVRGLLTLRFDAPRAFDHDERHLLTDFATQVAIALRNADFFAALERRATRFAAVAKVQQAISATVALRDVYREISHAVASVIDVASLALLSVAPDGATFRREYVVVDGGELRGDARRVFPIDDESAVQAARTAFGHIAARTIPGFGAPRDSGEGPQAVSEMTVPIPYGERVLGVMQVRAGAPDAYTIEDLDVVMLLARQAGAAIETARLFEAQRHERELAEAAATIARFALGVGNLHDAASAILEVLDGIAPSAGKALAVVEGRDTLHWLSALGEMALVGGTRASLGHGVGRELLNALHPVTIDSFRRSAPGLFSATMPDHGGVVIPLVARHRTIGVLAVSTSATTPLPPIAMSSLARLSDPVALAMDALLLADDERRRQERERMLATALATMNQPVLILDADTAVRYANEAAIREYGYSLEELTGTPVSRLVVSTTRGPSTRGDDPAAASGSRVTEQSHRRKDGSEFVATVTLSPIQNDAGHLVGQVVSARDLTDERRIAEQLRQTEKLAALGELVAGVAHELNNPLAGISAFAQLLLQDTLTQDQEESVHLIKREADRAVAVIKDLLIFSRKSGPRLVDVDLNELVQQTLRLRAYGLRSAGVDVVASLDRELPRLRGDDQKLQQVILNLVVNAEYAMQRSPTRRLSIATARETGGIVLRVEDTGMGMSPDVRKRIFEPFFTTKPAGVGTGLGLSVSYGIIQAHGGTIAVQSQPERGTTFEMRLPFRPPIEESSPARSE